MWAVLGVTAGAAQAGDGPVLAPANAGFRYVVAGPDREPSALDAKLDAADRPRFGEAGSRWWTVGTGVADNFKTSVDANLRLGYSYFLIDDIEFQLEGAGWHFNQPGDNAFGLSAVMVFRWHFVHTEKWTVYFDGGIGFGAGTDNIPDGGTSWVLMPRAGVGFTRELNDDGLRLEMGARWHHMSNARIFGDFRNPSRDGAMVYAGLVFPF